jgi:type I restriction enzyme M protein
MKTVASKSASKRAKPVVAASRPDPKKIIDGNSKFLDDINQLLHNNGVLFEKRIDIILQLIRTRNDGATFEWDGDAGARQALLDIIQATSISTEELFQKVFMFYGSSYLKKEFDQFYTPCTVGEFMCGLLEGGGKAIDPACGTGDLLTHYAGRGEVHLWDISPDVIELAKQNYAFQGREGVACVRDSIADYSAGAGEYDYALVNPPFGSKTVITNPDVLKHYVLGAGKKKQELGILFVERSMNLLRDGGVMAIILPNGYFGNTTAAFVELRKYILQWRVLAIIKLPQKTFARSGTGVSTSILVLSKTRADGAHYPIFIEEVVDIGYELNKKNTPYKYKKNKTEYVLDDGGRPVLQNDLYEVGRRLAAFRRGETGGCQTLSTADLDEERILDISRYLQGYKDIVENAAGKQPISDFLAYDYSCAFKRSDDTEYTYLDIKEINTPLYNGKKLLGHELPNRAKYMLKRNDILVSRLKGNIAFTVILEDKENLVCTNGVCVLRPRDEAAMLTIFANLFSADFKVQHQALTTGSIMETLSDDDIKNIVICTDVAACKYRKILDSIKTIQEEMAGL